MKKILIICLLSCMDYSCQKDANKIQLRIFVSNQTSFSMKVRLFPKSNFMTGDNYYSSDINSSELKNTVFDIESDMEQDLYTSADLSINPYDLVNKIFDSIQVINNNGGGIEMYFSPDTVTGCADNLFNDNSVWLYQEHNNFDPHNVLDPNVIKFNDYIFEIRSN